MKRVLLTVLGILGFSLAVNAAEPADLHKKIIEKRESRYVSNGWYTKRLGIEVLENSEYKISVNAEEHITDKGKCYRNLGFLVEDGSTEVSISDVGANGLSEKDAFDLQHEFSNGGNLSLSICYLLDDQYLITGSFFNGDSAYGGLHINTSYLNPLFRFFVKNKIKPIVECGRKVYDDVVGTCINGSTPDLPYKDTKDALSEIEALLEDIKDENDCTDVLIKFSDKYGEIFSRKYN